MKKLIPGYTFNERGRPRPRHIRGIIDNLLIIRIWRPDKRWFYYMFDIEKAEMYLGVGMWFNLRKSRDWR